LATIVARFQLAAAQEHQTLGLQNRSLQLFAQLRRVAILGAGATQQRQPGQTRQPRQGGQFQARRRGRNDHGRGWRGRGAGSRLVVVHLPDRHGPVADVYDRLLAGLVGGQGHVQGRRAVPRRGAGRRHRGHRRDNGTREGLTDRRVLGSALERAVPTRAGAGALTA